MKKNKLILIGGGGHCKACIDVIESTNAYEIIGILDHNQIIGTNVLNNRIIDSDNDILKYKEHGCHFLVTVGQIKSASNRKQIFQFLELHETSFATVISPQAYVSKHAKIGKGTIIMRGVTVNADAQVGVNCILNTGCDIEHDAVIGNHTHISTQAVVNGECKVGDEVFVGSNVTVSSKISVGNNIILGAGAVVIKDINIPGTYIGNPVKKL